MEDEAAHRANGLLICDTELTVIKIWAEHVFHTVPLWLADEMAALPPYDLYLLTNVEVNWQPDPQREHPDPKVRQHLFEQYERELTEREVNLKVITGADFEDRFQQAVAAIDELLEKMGLNRTTE